MGTPQSNVFPPEPESMDECGLTTPATPALLSGTHSCSDHPSDRLAKVPTESGTLALLASLRDSRGMYCDGKSDHDLGEAETHRVLAKYHVETLLDWLRMNLERQSRDLLSYFAMDVRAAEFARNRAEWMERLTPSGASPQERELFSHDLRLLLDAVRPEEKEAVEPRL